MATGRRERKRTESRRGGNKQRTLGITAVVGAVGAAAASRRRTAEPAHTAAAPARTAGAGTCTQAGSPSCSGTSAAVRMTPAAVAAG